METDFSTTDFRRVQMRAISTRNGNTPGQVRPTFPFCYIPSRPFPVIYFSDYRYSSCIGFLQADLKSVEDYKYIFVERIGLLPISSYTK